MEGNYSKALDQIYSLCFKKTMYTTKEKLIDAQNELMPDELVEQEDDQLMEEMYQDVQ